MTALHISVTVRRMFSVGPAAAPPDSRIGASAVSPFPPPLSDVWWRGTHVGRASIITIHMIPLGSDRLIIAHPRRKSTPFSAKSVKIPCILQVSPLLAPRHCAQYTIAHRRLPGLLCLLPVRSREPSVPLQRNFAHKISHRPLPRLKQGCRMGKTSMGGSSQ